MSPQRKKFDAYMTPSGITEALLRYEYISSSHLAFEPCVGDGIIRDALTKRRITVKTNDIDPNINTQTHGDASQDTVWHSPVDWTVTNPPFNKATPILKHAWAHSTVGVSFLLRLSFLEPTQARAPLLKKLALNLSSIIVFGQPRPCFTGNGKTDSTTVAWFTWRKDNIGGTQLYFATDWRPTT